MADYIDGIYKSVGKCGNASSVYGVLRDACKELAGMTDEEICADLESKYDIKENLYFTRGYEVVSDGIGAFACWVPLPYKNYKGDTLYAQFKKGDFEWLGIYIGTAESIIKHEIDRETNTKTKKAMQSGLNKFLAKQNKTAAKAAKKAANIVLTTVDSMKTDKQAKSSVEGPLIKPRTAPTRVATIINNNFDTEAFFYRNFYNKLLVKIGWSPSEIRSYLFTMIVRLNHLLSNKKGEEFIIRSTVGVNKLNYAMINTALLNTLGNPIKLMVAFDDKDINRLSEDYKTWQICDSKVTAMKNGFAKEDLSRDIPPVTYYDESPNELVFEGDLDEFDLENEGRLEHCITRQTERGVTDVTDMTKNQIYSDIKQAISTAIAISKYDKSYIKPMYNIRCNQLNYAIPYHSNGKFDEEPDMGIIVMRDEYGIWQVMTILELEDVKKNCKCLSPYSKGSF